MPLRNLTLLWDRLPPGGDGWDGFSLLIDDVERFRGTATNFSLALLDQGLPHFFRLAVSLSVSPCLRLSPVRLVDLHVSQFTKDGDVGDYTKAASFFPNGTWVDPPRGASY